MISQEEGTRLAREITKRREALRMTKSDFARASGLSNMTAARLESEGPHPRPRLGTTRAIENALLWRHGVVNLILEGAATEDDLSGNSLQASQQTGLAIDAASRGAAFREAAELLRDCSTQASAHDLIAVADWLLTGKTDAVIKFSEQRVSNRDHTPSSADAASWSPDEEVA